MFTNLLTTFADECAEGQIETALFGCYDGGIGGILALVLNIMMVCVGAAAVVGIIISGVQYSSSAGDPTTMAKAKKRILEIVIGVIAFGLLWVFLEWLIPGGVL